MRAADYVRFLGKLARVRFEQPESGKKRTVVGVLDDFSDDGGGRIRSVVPESGETEFPMFGLKVQPEKGKTLIWPAEWTHAHFGAVVKKGNKYIITGWMHYPDDALADT